MSAVIQLEVHDAAEGTRDRDLQLLHHAAAQASAMLQGSPYRSGLVGLGIIVSSAETALKSGDLDTCKSCLDAYFAEADRFNGPQQLSESKDQLMCRALFTAGQLVSELSSSFKGQPLIDGVLEAVKYIMQGVELAATNPRYSYLIYNGSVHHWHASRSLHCDQLRQHLLPSLEKLCQALEKVEGQTAWRVRQLMALALAQSEGPKPEEAVKTLAKAVDMAGAAGLLDLKHEVSALQTHIQSMQASKLTGGKPQGAGPVGKGPAGTAAGAATAKGAGSAAGLAAAARRRTGELASLQDKLDEGGALSILQWVMSSRPDAAAAEQQIRAAWKMVDPRPDGPSRNALLAVVARLAWAAALCGAAQLADQLAKRAATSPELGPRVWSDLTKLYLALQSAPTALLAPGDSAGYGSICSPEALQARLKILEGVDEAVTTFVKLHDVAGVHYCTKLAWNAGLPLLQQQHRHLLRPCFTAVAKALEATDSPLTKLRAVLHLAVAKAEADRESYSKAAKEVSLALSLNYPASAEATMVWGYERSLDRFLQPLARAARIRGGGVFVECREAKKAPDDDVVMLLERARESKGGAIRGDYLRKAIDKLALLPDIKPPAPLGVGAPFDAAAASARAEQLRAARSRTELWADIVQLAWMPCELEGLVREAAPYVLPASWQDTADKEMMLLQSRTAYMEADACKAALRKLELEVIPPAGYNALDHLQPSTKYVGSGEAEETDVGPGAAYLNDAGVRLPSLEDVQLQRLFVEDLLLGMRLATAAGQPWALMNGALAAWNAYVPVMQKQRYAELAGVLLPLLKQMLQEPGQLDTNMCVMLAEAAAKSAEHVALLQLLKPNAAAEGSDVDDEEDDDARWQLWGFRAGVSPGFVPLAEARANTANMDAAKRLQSGGKPVHKSLLQLLSTTADTCQVALAKATSASEPQGLIQAYARLQQLQGKAAAVPPGAPASMAVTSKVLGIIEGLTAATACISAGAAPGPAAAGQVGVVGGAVAVGAKPLSAAKPGDKGATPLQPASNPEQDIRTAMQLLSSAPAVNLELWSQLSRAAGCQGCWQLAKECAVAALGALPAGKRDLGVIRTPGEVPEVSGQAWYWLSVAEMQQGQAILSLLAPSSQQAATQLSLQHKALSHFATATKLASLISRADLAEAAARLAWNACTANGAAGLLATGLTKASVVPMLRGVVTALNATRPSDPSFQVSCNILLLECLAAAGQWAAARQHVDSLQRCLPLKSHGPAAAAAVAIAGWRAACLARAPPSKRVMEDMNRLLSELSTPQAKAHAWLAFGQACSKAEEQLAAKKAAIAALDGLPLEQVDYQIELAEWLLVTGNETSDAGTAAAALLQAAIRALRDVEAAAAVVSADVELADESDEAAPLLSGSSKPATTPLPGYAPENQNRVATSSAITGVTKDQKSRRTGTAAITTVQRSGRTASHSTGQEHGGCDEGKPLLGLTVKQIDQLIQAHNLLAQATHSAADRESSILQAQQYCTYMITGALTAAGAVPSSHIDYHNPPRTDVQSVNTTIPMTPPPAGAAPAPTAQTALTSAESSQAAAVTFPNSQQMLDWTIWTPDAALLARMQAHSAASHLSSNSQRSGGAAASGRVAGQATGSSGGSAALQVGKQFALSSLRVPELTLANLQWLAEQLQSAGQHVTALPVLQLAKLVATVVIRDQALETVVTLQLSSVCEALGLVKEANTWLTAAAPESWPSRQQLQQTEQHLAVHHLVENVLVHAAHTAVAAAAAQPGVSEEVEIDVAMPPAPAAFLTEGLKQADHNTMQSWLCSGTDNSSTKAPAECTEVTAAASVQGTLRPGSAHRLLACQAAAQAMNTSRSITSSVYRTSGGVIMPGEEAVLAGRVQWLKPLTMQDCWVEIAKFLVDHGQYTAAMKLCTAAMPVIRASNDTASEASILLLQARLAALAQQPEAAISAIQSAQALGGDVKLWRDSLLLYADVRGNMRSGAFRDAREALDGGIAMLEAVARGTTVGSHTAITAACQLRLHLSQLLSRRAQQQLQEGEADVAVQLHRRALEVVTIAAEQLQQTGGRILRVQVLQQAAELMIKDPQRIIQQQHHHQLLSRQQLHVSEASAIQAPDAGKRAVVLPLDERPLLLEVRQLLQVAEQEAHALVTACNPDSLVTSFHTTTIPDDSAPSPTAASRVFTPVNRLWVSLQLQLAQVELELSRLCLQYTAVDKAARRPQFPVVEGRNPAAVVEYLEQAEGYDKGTSCSHDGTPFHQRALQHAQAATAAAAGSGSASSPQHAAALLAAGEALMQQVHAVMVAEHLAAAGRHAVVAAGTGAGAAAAAAVLPEAFDADAVWVPWPTSMLVDADMETAITQQHQQQQQQPVWPALLEGDDGSSAADNSSAPSGAAGQQQQKQQQQQQQQQGNKSSMAAVSSSSSSSGGETKPPAKAPSNAGAAAAAAAETADSVTQESTLGLSADPPTGRANVQSIPAAALEPYNAAVQHLQEALSAALLLQQLQIARSAALALVRCYGQLQPQLAAECLAVAQACHSAIKMKDVFLRCASEHHGEVLTWRQLDILQQPPAAAAAAAAAAAPVGHYMQQAHQLLSLIGVTNSRLQAPATGAAAFRPLLSQLQPEQRLLLLHYDETRQELLLAAWNVEGDLPLALEDGSLSTGGGTAAGQQQTEAAADGKSSAKRNLAAAAGAAATAAAAAASVAPPRVAIIGRMPLPQKKLKGLLREIEVYKQHLAKKILDVTSKPPPPPPAAAAAAAMPPVAAAAIGRGATKGAAAGPAAAAGAAGGGGKGSSSSSSKDKASKEDERGAAAAAGVAVVPAVPVFPEELNQRWDELLQKFASLLEPLLGLLRKALPAAAAAAASGDDHRTAAAAAGDPAARPPSGAGKKPTKGTAATGAAGAAAKGSQQQQQQLLSVQLLLDPVLCPLPWEALPHLGSSCSSVSRCFSLAQLQGLSQGFVAATPAAAAAAVGAISSATPGPAAAAVVPAVLDISRLTCLVDVGHELSGSGRPGCYAPPLIPAFKQQFLDVGGCEWQGVIGVPGQLPGHEQLSKAVAGSSSSSNSKGVIMMGPGRLLGMLPPKYVAELDLTHCPAALLFDRLDSEAAAARQLHLDNRKYPDERELEDPTHTAMLLLLRGVRSVALATIAGTPYTHLQLASSVLKAMGSAGGGRCLSEAVWAAKKEVLGGFELAALCDCGLVVYGLGSVVAGEGEGKKGTAGGKK